MAVVALLGVVALAAVLVFSFLVGHEGGITFYGVGVLAAAIITSLLVWLTVRAAQGDRRAPLLALRVGGLRICLTHIRGAAPVRIHAGPV